MPFIELDSRETAGKHWVERGEQGRQRTSSRESNSGRHEHRCAVGRRINHEGCWCQPTNHFFIYIYIYIYICV